MNKYELTRETRTFDGQTLYRIRALRDFSDVRAGDLGGWVAGPNNLSQRGDCWVYDNASMYDNSHMSGDASMFGNARMYDNARMFGSSRMSGDARMYGNARMFGDAIMFDNARMYDNSRMRGNARMFGSSRMSGDARMSDNSHMSGDASISGEASISGNALVERLQHVLTIGPIGSRDDHLTFYRTADGGGEVHTGCFTGTIESFEAAVKETHAGTAFESEYLALVQLMRIREQSWLGSSK